MQQQQQYSGFFLLLFLLFGGMSAVQVCDAEGKLLGKVKVGDTKLDALERLSLNGGLFDKDDVGLLNDDRISAEGAPYVFKNLANTTGELDEVLEYVRRQKEESETLVISNPQTQRYAKAVAKIDIPRDAPVWDNKPTTSRNPPPYIWLASKEDSPENRAGYMDYLRQHVALPNGTVFFDGNADGDLLTVVLQDFGLKLSGNIDVLLAKSRHQTIVTVKENMLGALELKKDSNKEQTRIERQVTLQHIAASYLNPDTGILTVMTDLHDRWHFFWFVRKNQKRLMRYNATKSDALFLIEHMLDEEGSVSTPDGFLSRASWNELFLTNIPDDNDNDDDEQEHGGDGGFPKGKETRPKHGKRLKSSGTQHAMEDECLDFMDKEEELEEMLHFALQTSFHRMFGPPDTATNTAGRSLPSQINFYP